jgi:hypothetical protein
MRACGIGVISISQDNLKHTILTPVVAINRSEILARHRILMEEG